MSSPPDSPGVGDLSRLPSLDRPFRPLTDAHEEELEIVESALGNFSTDNTPDAGPTPMAIVGAYRSGKTQLEYHIFRKSWVEHGIPAVFVGEPKQMLDQFEEQSKEPSLFDWLYGGTDSDSYGRIVEEIMAMVNREYDDVSWFPSVREDVKRRWINENVPTDLSASDVDQKFVFILDELEQSYRKFQNVIETEDNNPLRRLNDSKPNALNVWSFGLLSAYEFVGDADIGRAKQVTIPPLDTEATRELIRREMDGETTLTNIIWWASRGRAGWAFKIADEVGSVSGEEELVNWMDELADLEFAEVDVIRRLWADVDPSEYDAAARTLAFSDNYEPWITRNDLAINVDDLLIIIDSLLRDTDELSGFTGNDSIKEDAVNRLRQNIERTLESLTTDNYLPALFLNEDQEARAFLNIVQTFLISFEARSEARTLAYETLEAAKQGFNSDFTREWVTFQDDIKNDHDTWIIKPSVLNRAFPPVTMNPEQLTDESTEGIKSAMGQGLEVEISARASVYYCPTEDTALKQLGILGRDSDISQPVVVMIPQDLEDDIIKEMPDRASTLRKNDILRVESQPATRMWDFVTQLYGRLEASGFDNPYLIDEGRLRQLVKSAETREERDTLQTLYEQLSDREGQRVADRLVEDYLERFGIDDETIIWEHETIASSEEWTSTTPSDFVRCLKHIFSLGASPMWNEPYGSLRNRMHEAYETEELIDSNDFGYRIVLRNLFTQNGFAEPVEDLRELYYKGDSSQLILPIRNTRALLSSLAEPVDEVRLRDSLTSTDTDADENDIPVLEDITVDHPSALSFLRAVLTMAVFRDYNQLSDELNALADQFKSLKNTISDLIDDVNNANEKLAPPEGIDVGTNVTLATAILGKYQTNCADVEGGVRNLSAKSDEDPDLRVTALGFKLLVKQYESAVRDEIDSFSSSVLDIEALDTIAGLKDAFTELHKEASEFEAANEHFTSQDQLVADIEAIGNELIDLASMSGTPRIVLLDSRASDQLLALGKAASDHRGTVEQLRDDLSTLIKKHDTREERYDDTYASAESLLKDATEGGSDDK